MATFLVSTLNTFLRLFYLDKFWLLLSLTTLLALLFFSSLVYEMSQIHFLIQHPLSSYVMASHKQVNFKTSTLRTPTVSVATWHLFGQDQSLPTPNTTWSLHGIILGKNADNNLAILASSDTNEQVYKRGDQLKDGAVIFKILPDQVQLSNNGMIETLSILWKENSKEQTPVAESDHPANTE